MANIIRDTINWAVDHTHPVSILFRVVYVHLLISVSLVLYIFLASDGYMTWLFIVILYITFLSMLYLTFGWCVFNKKLRSQRMEAGQAMELGDRPVGSA